jgi:hypothetical protein
MKPKKNATSTTDEPMPDLSMTESHIISKPWRESKIAHNWMLEETDDPLFNVSVYTPSITKHRLIPLSEFFLEPQEIRSITGPRAGR